LKRERMRIVGIEACDKVERSIIAEIDEIARQDRDTGGIGDEAWTMRLKNALCKLGKPRGYWVGASHCGEQWKDGGEWLFDLIWIRYENDVLLSVPLAVESEWGTPNQKTDPIDDDFQKLVVARAERRLMLFQARGEPEARDQINKLLKHTQSGIAQAEDRFLFGCWLGSERRLLWDLHVVG